MTTKRRPCSCSAYPFPHARGGGSCGGRKTRVRAHRRRGTSGVREHGRNRADGRVRIEVADRPYRITFRATGTSYPLTAEEVRRLEAEYPLVAYTPNRMTLRADDGQKVTISPATLGGGPSFRKRR